MAEQVALHERASSAAYLTECIRYLNRYKDNARVSKRLLQQKLGKVVEGKEVLPKKYYAYAEKANKDLDSEQLVSWITPNLDIANNVLDKVFIIIEELEAKSENEQLQAERDTSSKALEDKKKMDHAVAQLQADTDEATLKEKITMMTEVINDVDRTSKEDGVLVEAYLKEVSAALEDQIKSWNTLKLLTIDNKKLVEIFSKETEVKGYVSNRCSL